MCSSDRCASAALLAIGLATTSLAEWRAGQPPSSPPSSSVRGLTRCTAVIAHHAELFTRHAPLFTKWSETSHWERRVLANWEVSTTGRMTASPWRACSPGWCVMPMPTPRSRRVFGWFVDATDGPRAAMRAVGVPFGRGVSHCIRFVLARMEVTLIVAGLAQRLVLVPTFPTLPRPDGVAVNQPAGGVPIRCRPRTLSDVEPVSPT